MANKRITDLELRSSFSDTCNVPVDDTIQSWRVTGTQMAAYIATKGATFTYDAAVTYAADAYVLYSGNYYKSLQASNTAHTPGASPTWWMPLPFFAPSSQTGDYTVTDTDGVRNIDVTTSSTNYTVTLPTVADNKGREITVYKKDSGTGKVTIDGEGSETIDGEANFVLWVQGDSATFCSDGAGWYIKAKKLVINGKHRHEGQTNFSSSNTWIPYYGGQTISLGSSLSSSNSSTTGLVVTVNQRGLYRIQRQTQRTGGTCFSTITKNVTTGLSAALANMRAYAAQCSGPTGTPVQVNATLVCDVGDTIRGHAFGSEDTNITDAFFEIEQIARW